MTDEQLKTIIDILISYLRKNNLRNTPERVRILTEIYMLDGHFSVDDLYFIMKSKNYRVSKATLYNTVELLTKCKLVKKHQFNKKTARYEKAYRSSQHDHVICLNCGKIVEFCDPRLHEIIKDVSGANNFRIGSHELYLYGLCEKCQNLSKT